MRANDKRTDQAWVSQKTRKLLGPENGPVKTPKQLSGVSQSAQEVRARENHVIFPVNFTGALELPRTFLGTDFIAIKLHPEVPFLEIKSANALNEKDVSIGCEGERDLV